MTPRPLRDRLHALLAQPLARQLAAASPFWIVSAASGAAIGASLSGALPQDAALTGALSGMATNIVSATLYDIVKPNVDDEPRAELIARGLEQRDPAVLRLVAEALVAAGPDLADALPANTRADLIAALQAGMAQSGGPLAAIAPRYAEALHTPPDTWPAVQSELRQMAARVSQTMDASEDGVITGSRQTATHTGGPVDQTMRATKGGRIENSTQEVRGPTDPKRPKRS